MQQDILTVFGRLIECYETDHPLQGQAECDDILCKTTARVGRFKSVRFKSLISIEI